MGRGDLKQDLTTADETLFDRRRLRILPLAERTHDLDISVIRALDPVEQVDSDLRTVAARIVAARQAGAATILMMGAHVIRSGVQRYIIDLMERGLLSCVALNGAGMIHDYEFARIGATTESVARYIADGRFGLWRETGAINDLVARAAEQGKGLGAAVGAAIEEGEFPHKAISILAAGARYGVPVTVHVGIGYDILHEHPNCDGAAYGATSYRDFLRFTKIMERLEDGVVMNFGSAVMAPEIYLKALAMVRNVAIQEARSIQRFTTLVCDVVELPDNYREAPDKQMPSYYFRPWKTMLVRTVADGGESFYVRGSHAETVPALWTGVRA